jgi:hypothetical protein
LAWECAHRERQTSVNAGKICSHFGEIQLMSASCQSIHLLLGDTFRADIRAQSLRNVSRHARAMPETYPPSLSRMCWRRCCRPDFNPHARHVSDGAHGGNQPAFRGPEICGVGTEEDAAERDLTPRTISNCLRHLEIKPSKRSLTSNSFIKPSTVAGSPISINL